MFLASNVALPAPTSLYWAVMVQAPGVRPAISDVALARTSSLPATRSEIASDAAVAGQVALADMKPAAPPVLPSISAVRITSTLPEAGTVTLTDGPVSGT